MSSSKSGDATHDYDPNLFDHCGRWDLTRDVKQEERVAQAISLVPESTHSILDVGCGDGLISRRLPRRGRVVGCDTSLTGLKMTQIPSVCGSLLRLPFADQSFDLVTAFEVLEHLPPPMIHQACAEISRVARYHVLISVPNREALDSRFGRCTVCGQIFHIYNHLSSFTQKSVKTLFPDYTMKTLHLTPHTRFAAERLPRWLRAVHVPVYTWAPHITCPHCRTTNFPPSTLQTWGLRLTRLATMLTFWWRAPGGWILALFERPASGA